jgi:Domain of unknown function (DUF4124)
MKFIRSTLPYLVASFAIVFSASAMAQYMWLDASGRKVFSDQPPPASIPAKRVLQQPGKAAVVTKEQATEGVGGYAGGSSNADVTTESAEKPVVADKKPSQDKDLEAAKKKIDDEAATKKKAEQDKIDVAKADNCKRAKSAKATLDSGVRLAHTNAKGERGFMDDASRMVEAKRLEGIITADCK